MLFEARDLTAILPGDTGDVRVLDAVSLSVDAGEVVDVVGPSGSGKSTLLRALARLLPGATGSLAVSGTPASAGTPQQWRRMVTLLPQKPVMLDGSVRDNLLVPWTLGVRRDQPRPDDTALADGLERLNVDAALDRDASRLSVGQAARIAFLRTLLTDPVVLLLDEPDAALDAVAADALASLMAEFVAEHPGRDARAVVRVRHHHPDGLATRRMCLEGGSLTAEAAAS